MVERKGSRWNELIGHFWTSSRVGRSLGLTEEEVKISIEQKRFLVLKTKDGVLVFPSFQFTQDKDDQSWSLLSGLDQVLAQFRDVVTDESSSWTLASWLNAPSAVLEGKSIIQHLREGNDTALVIGLAQDTAERWAN